MCASEPDIIKQFMDTTGSPNVMVALPNGCRTLFMLVYKTDCNLGECMSRECSEWVKVYTQASLQLKCQ